MCWTAVNSLSDDSGVSAFSLNSMEAVMTVLFVHSAPVRDSFKLAALSPLLLRAGLDRHTAELRTDCCWFDWDGCCHR